MVGHQVADVERGRDAPFRRDGHLICVGVDDSANGEWSRRAGMEFVSSLHGVAFGPEPDHHHISLLIRPGPAVGIDGSLDFGVVCVNPLLH